MIISISWSLDWSQCEKVLFRMHWRKPVSSSRVTQKIPTTPELQLLVASSVPVSGSKCIEDTKSPHKSIGIYLHHLPGREGHCV